MRTVKMAGRTSTTVALLLVCFVGVASGSLGVLGRVEVRNDFPRSLLLLLLAASRNLVEGHRVPMCRQESPGVGCCSLTTVWLSGCRGRIASYRRRSRPGGPNVQEGRICAHTSEGSRTISFVHGDSARKGDGHQISSVAKYYTLFDALVCPYLTPQPCFSES